MNLSVRGSTVAACIVHLSMCYKYPDAGNYCDSECLIVADKIVHLMNTAILAWKSCLLYYTSLRSYVLPICFELIIVLLSVRNLGGGVCRWRVEPVPPLPPLSQVSPCWDSHQCHHFCHLWRLCKVRLTS